MTARLLSLLVPLLAVLAPVLAAGQPAAPGRWLGADGRPLPFATDDEVLDFLRKARVVGKKVLTSGSNRPLKLRLARDGVEAHAVFRNVDIKRKRAKIRDRIYLDFHDSYIYECAAFVTSRLLGIDNVPPCVERKIDNRDGTLQLWIEGATTEKQRRESGIQAPVTLSWLRQKQTLRLFDALIYNFDRNQGNMLIDASWKLWFIDHTRSFTRTAEIEAPEKIVWCQRGVWERLQDLDKKQLSRQLRPFVSPVPIQALLKRRDKLVDLLQARIDELGEGAVLFDHGAGGPTDLAVAALEDEPPDSASTTFPQ